MATLSLGDVDVVAIGIRALGPDDRSWMEAAVTRLFASTRLVSRGRLLHAGSLPGYVAEIEGARQGLLTFHVDGDELEVVTLQADVAGRGLGTALLSAAEQEARRRGLRRLWLVTTNDNVPAIRYYERRGMTLLAVHEGAMIEARKIKPEIPELGIGGVPIRDEIEFELLL